MTTLAFRSKAETLEALSGRLRTATVLPLVHFTVADWRRDAKAVLCAIDGTSWGREEIIVRSSALAEDSQTGSNAGHFLSVGHVAGLKMLRTSIEQVVASYGSAAHDSDRVLVQPHIANVKLSGVAFSRDPNTGAPYFVINYDDSGDTSAVTAGVGQQLRTVYLWPDGPADAENRLARVAELIRELDGIFEGTPLDIEFAQDGDGALYLFQVRPLVMRNRAALDQAHQTGVLAAISSKIDRANRPHPYLHGRRTVYGVMPDWNPAEIIGVRPRPLALSLYKEIITDSIWAYQRHNYGYQNLRSFPLMVEFCGLPYIDVRVSFNSFVPADLPDELANRLVDYYIEQLLATPHLHDKVEFEIALTCHSFDLDNKLAKLKKHGFSVEDCELIRVSLNRLTNRIIHRESGLWRQDSERIDVLAKRHALISAADLDTISRIYWLLEDCKRYGTLPFAGLARAGFIAVQMLRSLVEAGVLTDADRASFMAGLDTVSSRMGRDFATLDRDAFLRAYGHLRPGTYDILSPRYDDAPDRYFDWSQPRIARASDERPKFALTLQQMRAIERLLAEHKLEHDVVGLFDFLEAGIRGREYSKFIFTRSLSDALRLVGCLGKEHGFTLDDMSYVDIRAIYGLYTSSADVRTALTESIVRGRRAYAQTQMVVLPPLIASGSDVWQFEMPPNEPNFVTQGRVSGAVTKVQEGVDLRGKIAFLTNADPGYDWIFARGIAGFITAYGGANSHMAIRASELQLPAVVGAGEVLFDRWSAASIVEIDAANRQVRVIR